MPATTAIACHCGRPATIRITGSGPGAMLVCDTHAEVERLIHGRLLRYELVEQPKSARCESFHPQTCRQCMKRAGHKGECRAWSGGRMESHDLTWSAR